MSTSSVLTRAVVRCNEACELATTGGTPFRAVRLALIVGSLLVVINQWEALVGAQAVNWSKLVLTYCVPYLVSTYTSVSKDLQQRRLLEATAMADHEARKRERTRTQ